MQNLKTIKAGNIMVVFAPSGRIDDSEHPASGIYYLDTKLVKRVKCVPSHFIPLKIETEGNRAITVFAAREIGSIPALIEVIYTSDGKSVEIKRKVYWAKKDADLCSIEIVYTHEDIFEVRARARKLNFPEMPPSGASISREGNSVAIRAKNVSFTIRETKKDHKSSDSLTLTIEPSLPKKAPANLFAPSRPFHIVKELPELRDCLGRLVHNAFKDIETLCFSTKFGPVPAAGLPWFCAVYGRDTLIFCIHSAEVLPEVAESSLRFLASLQGDGLDPERDMQPGKIPHEIRIADRFLSGKVPFDRYYGTADATPLFIAAVASLWRATRDRRFLEDMIGHVDRAIEWIEKHGDMDGDGFVEYVPDRFLKNKAWKDSKEGISHPDGTAPTPPIAVVEVQAYAYLAYLEAANLHRELGHKEKAQELTRKAISLRQRFSEAFWEGSYAVLGLDGEKRKIKVISSNPAHALFTGIFDGNQVEAIVRRVFQSDMLTRWGIRTVSSRMGIYDPTSYHNGSIWPFDNAMIILGLMGYGFFKEAEDLALRLLRASTYFGHRLPELYCGFDSEVPVPHPGAGLPQLWSASSAFVIAKALGETL